jgi:hypothetical protein
MKSGWTDRLAVWGGKHPVLMTIGTLVLAAACAILFLSSSKGQAVLYQAY